LDGLYQLEKLTIKDTKAPLDILNNLPSLKEFETNIENLNDKEKCQLVEKLANGQLAVQGKIFLIKIKLKILIYFN
jgi:hypothetical protein